MRGGLSAPALAGLSLYARALLRFVAKLAPVPRCPACAPVFRARHPIENSYIKKAVSQVPLGLFSLLRFLMPLQRLRIFFDFD